MSEPHELVQFLHELAENNNRDWFEANRPRYQALRDAWTELIQQVILALAARDPALEGLSSTQSLFRIHRDVRFSKNKEPYKTAFSALLSPGGKDMAAPGYYTQVDHRGILFAGGGLHMPEADLAFRIRSHLAIHYGRVEEILADPHFRSVYPRGITDERLKKAPRGFDENHPAIDLLKLKSFTVASETTLETTMTQGDLFERMVDGLSAAVPYVIYLREAVGGRPG